MKGETSAKVRDQAIDELLWIGVRHYSDGAQCRLCQECTDLIRSVEVDFPCRTVVSNQHIHAFRIDRKVRL